MNRNNGQTYPKLKSASEQDAAYHAALELVARIDEDLTRGVRHYRTKAGVLLTALDEVMVAILTGNLMVQEEQAEPWVRPVCVELPTVAV